MSGHLRTARRPYLFSRVVSSPWSCCRKDTVVCSRGSVSHHDFDSAIAWRGCTHTRPRSPIALRLSNALVSYAKYLLLAFWPNDLAVFYPFPDAGIPAWQIIGAALLLIGITAFCFFQRKIRPYLIVGWLWFLGTLVPVIGLVHVGGQTMADRYFYIPSIGLFIALVFGLADIAERLTCCSVAQRSNSWRRSAGLLLPSRTRRFIVGSDSFTLFEHTLAVTPPNFRIEYNLGVAFAKSDRYDEAAAHFEKALQIRPDDYTLLLYHGRYPFLPWPVARSHRICPSGNPFTGGLAESARPAGHGVSEAEPQRSRAR